MDNINTVNRLEQYFLSNLEVVPVPIETLVPYVNNARTHSDKQVALIASSIKEFGFNDPIAIDAQNGIIEGHGRVMAAKLLGMKTVPAIQLGHLTKYQQKAYILAHNRVALDAEWDHELLKIELDEIKDSGEVDIDACGFTDDEVESWFDEKPEAENTRTIVSEVGDVWILENKKLTCADNTLEHAVLSLYVNDGQYINFEIEPEYCDQLIQKWQKVTGKQAILEGTGQTFEGMKNERWQGMASTKELQT